MIFGKGERRRTICTSSENLTKSTEIAAFWQGSFYSWLAYQKWRMQFCIRHFFCSRSWIRPRFVNTAKPYCCRGAPACGKRQIPVLSNIFAFILCRGSRLRETANSRRTKRLAAFFLPSDETTCSHFFEILFNCCLTRRLTFLAYRE